MIILKMKHGDFMEEFRKLSDSNIVNKKFI